MPSATMRVARGARVVARDESLVRLESRRGVTGGVGGGPVRPGVVSRNIAAS